MPVAFLKMQVWPTLSLLSLCLALAGTSVGAPPAAPRQLPPPGAHTPSEPPTTDTVQERAITRKQKKDLLKMNFEKMKHDADELADLAKSLQDDLGKSNENVLSLDVVEKAEKIEKLAKKIKSSAKGM